MTKVSPAPPAEASGTEITRFNALRHGVLSRYTVLPWLKGGRHAELQTMREYLRVAFNRVPIALLDKSWLNRTVYELISIPARWRLDHDYYKYPVELWVKDLVNQVISPPKPKVDAKRLSSEPVTC